MRVCLIMAAVFGLASAASAAEPDRPTAIVVSPIHEAQIVRADDGKDHVECELLAINVFPEAVTLSSLTVLDPAGKELMRIEGNTLPPPPPCMLQRLKILHAFGTHLKLGQPLSGQGADGQRSTL